MLKQDRLMEITNIMQSKKRIRTEELAKITFFFFFTIRRDVIFLEKQGLVKRLHGEIILNNFNTVEPSQFLRESENVIKKRTIASLAKDFIAPGMCIYLDSSTTVYELCPFLCDIEHLIIFTNGLNTALKLAEYGKPTMKIFITGGEVKHFSSSVVTGFFKINDLKKYRAIISDKLPNKNILNATELLDVEWISGDEEYI